MQPKSFRSCLTAALMWSGACLALSGCGGEAIAPAPAESAEDFVQRVESELAEVSEYASRAAWVMNNFITEDTMWLQARAGADYTRLATGFAVEAARFDDVETDIVTRRKLEILKRALVLPAPARSGAAEELSTIGSRLDSAYSTGTFSRGGTVTTLDEAEDILRTLRDPEDIRAIWEGWRTVSPPMKDDYERLVALSNEGARELGFADTGELWRSWYDMEPDEFAQKMDALWEQVAPFYINLHCYVRAKLNGYYGDDVQPASGPIRADLTGNMWAQQWGNIYDIVAPEGVERSYDLSSLLNTKGYDAIEMVRTGEGFYTSLGLPPLPDTFWERSLFVRPEDREVVCHASAWDIDNKNDIRIKMCTRVNADDFDTVHHELGHNFYQRAYAGQDFIFRDGANDGFHEAIGDFAGLNAVTPTYLNQIGLLETVPGTEEDIPFLLRMALDKIAFLPFGLLMDKWRWGVFSGDIPPEQYNDAWWELRTRYQGITPPGARPTQAFDPGAKYHIPASTPYARYFLAFIYEFQFYRSACRDAGWDGPLNRCSVYGNTDVGEKLNRLLETGQSRPWRETLAEFTGENDIDASAIQDYFSLLNDWLTEQNQGLTCGW
jgi:peptidyl-dipeptidase A